jgi:hypothetical protein
MGCGRQGVGFLFGRGVLWREFVAERGTDDDVEQAGPSCPASDPGQAGWPVVVGDLSEGRGVGSVWSGPCILIRLPVRRSPIEAARIGYEPTFLSTRQTPTSG